MMRLAILALTLSMCYANPAPAPDSGYGSSPSTGATTISPITGGYGSSVVSTGTTAAPANTGSYSSSAASASPTTPSASSASPASTAPASTTTNPAGSAATTAAGYGTTASNNGQGSTSAGNTNGNSGSTPSGNIKPGTFVCKHQGSQKCTYKNKILNLDPLASLNGYCQKFAADPKCSGAKPQLGGLVDISNKAGCLLDLNVLNLCDVNAIVSNLLTHCPKYDKEALCISACACCGDNVSILDVCVKACLSSQGNIGVDVDPLSVLTTASNNGQGSTNAATTNGNSGSTPSGTIKPNTTATFICKHQGSQKCTYKKKILNLDPLASLEGYCQKFSSDPKCSGAKPQFAGLVATSNKAGCLLDLNVLNLCDVNAIVSNLLTHCPKYDKEALCIAACACCGDNGSILDVCVKACLTSQRHIAANVDPLSVLEKGSHEGKDQAHKAPKDRWIPFLNANAGNIL